MNVGRMKELLETAMDAIASLSLAELLAKPDDQLFEEHGLPNDPSGYCQIAVERLERYEDEGVERLDLSVTASDSRRTIGAIVSVYGDARPGVVGEVVEFCDGAAVPIRWP